MASYDYAGIKAEGGAYVLEAGNYEISLRTDSHTVVGSQTVTVEKDVIYNDDNDGARSSDKVAATNEFDDVSFDDGITYVSRADWAGTMAGPSTVRMWSALTRQLLEMRTKRPGSSSVSS